MSTKQKSTEKTSQKTTANPPWWTQQGLAQVAGDVMESYGESQVFQDNNPYTGDFVATWDPRLLGESQVAYDDAATKAGWAGNWLMDMAGDARVNAAPSFDTSFGAARPFDFGMGPDLSGLEDILGGGAAGLGTTGSAVRPEYLAAHLLAKPDFAGMMPALADTPDFKGFDPTSFQADDGGARLTAAMEAAIQPVMRQLTNEILPGIKSSSIEAGAYSGDRAMSVIPSEVIAQAGQRASEITQQLSYQGFQQEEARRLAAWQAEQEFGVQLTGMENDFNSDMWAGTNAFNQGNFNTLVGAEGDAYGIGMNAALSSARDANAWGLDLYRTDQSSADNRYGINTEAALAMEKMGQDQYQQWVGNMYNQGQQANESFQLQTDRTLGAEQETRAAQQLASDMYLNSIMTETGQGDIYRGMMEMLTQGDQLAIQDAMARNEYGITSPYAGQDIVTQLLQGLSGNWGSGTMDGTSVRTSTTSGLGPVLQGMAGLAMAAGSMGAFGPIGTAASAASKAGSGLAQSVWGGGARGGSSA